MLVARSLCRLWVSNSRVADGRTATTHTHCDDEPSFVIGDFPTPREPRAALEAGAVCSNLGGQAASAHAKREAYEAYGCRYQSNPHTGFTEGPVKLPYSLPTWESLPT